MRCLPWGPWAMAWLAAREPSTCGRSCQKVSSVRDGITYHWRGSFATDIARQFMILHAAVGVCLSLQTSWPDGVDMRRALLSFKPRSHLSYNAGSAGPPCSWENCVCLHTHGP